MHNCLITKRQIWIMNKFSITADNARNETLAYISQTPAASHTRSYGHCMEPIFQSVARGHSWLSHKRVGRKWWIARWLVNLSMNNGRIALLHVNYIWFPVNVTWNSTFSCQVTNKLYGAASNSWNELWTLPGRLGFLTPPNISSQIWNTNARSVVIIIRIGPMDDWML